MKWEIYYDDGFIYTSEDGPWDAAPMHGVQFVVEYTDSGERIIHMKRDYYFKIGNTIASMYSEDLQNFLNKNHPEIKCGRWMDTEGWKKLRELVG